MGTVLRTAKKLSKNLVSWCHHFDKGDLECGQIYGNVYVYTIMVNFMMIISCSIELWIFVLKIHPDIWTINLARLDWHDENCADTINI